MEKDNKLEKVGSFVSSTISKIVNAVIVVLIIALVGVIAWFWHNNEIEKGNNEILQKQVKELKMELEETKKEKKDLEVKNVEVEEMENVVKNEVVMEEKKEFLTSGWKVYKNAKYKYSFKYPKDWYIYEGKNFTNQNKRCNLHTNLEFPYDKLNEFDENDVVLSKTKLGDCSIGNLNDGSFGGDILISSGNGIWDAGDPNEVIEKIEKKGGIDEYGQEIFMFGDVKSQMVKSSKELDENDPKELKFWARTGNFDYFVMITQKDNKKDMDPELMKVLNSLIIEK